MNISDTQVIKRLRGENSTLTKQRNNLKAKNKKLLNELIKIKGQIMRLQAELEDD